MVAIELLFLILNLGQCKITSFYKQTQCECGVQVFIWTLNYYAVFGACAVNSLDLGSSNGGPGKKKKKYFSVSSTWKNTAAEPINISASLGEHEPARNSSRFSVAANNVHLSQLFIYLKATQTRDIRDTEKGRIDHIYGI